LDHHTCTLDFIDEALCNNPVVGLKLQALCPGFCEKCTSSTTTITSTTTTTATCPDGRHDVRCSVWIRCVIYSRGFHRISLLLPCFCLFFVGKGHLPRDV
jgi:hypothetical protein